MTDRSVGPVDAPGRDRTLRLRPKDQIILLAGLAPDERRRRIWSLPQLRSELSRLTEAGLIDADGGALSVPAGVAAARRIRHIALDDLLAEHLPSAF